MPDITLTPNAFRGECVPQKGLFTVRACCWRARMTIASYCDWDRFLHFFRFVFYLWGERWGRSSSVSCAVLQRRVEFRGWAFRARQARNSLRNLRTSQAAPCVRASYVQRGRDDQYPLPDPSADKITMVGVFALSLSIHRVPSITTHEYCYRRFLQVLNGSSRP